MEVKTRGGWTMEGTRRLGAVTLLVLLAATAAAADLLVTRDGQIVETRGGWEVRGRLLVFRLADGTLASMRLEEVDLEASETRSREAELRTRRARQEALIPPPEPARATTVITDRDVTHLPALTEQQEAEGGTTAAAGDASPASDDTTLDADSGDGGEEDPADPATASSQGVQVVEWSQEPEGETGLAVRGVIENLGSSVAAGLSLNALFYDGAGALVAAREVDLVNRPLEPGGRQEFSVSLPELLIYEEIRFLVVGRGFRSIGQSVRVAPLPVGD